MNKQCNFNSKLYWDVVEMSASELKQNNSRAKSNIELIDLYSIDNYYSICILFRLFRELIEIYKKVDLV